MKKPGIKLTDIIDIDFLQKFQDSFAYATNVASLMVDNDGPITKPSNFTDFCIKYTRGSEIGFKRCNECDIRWGKAAANKGKPVIYNCHTGLTDFAVPIMVDGQHIASILGGQIITKPPNQESFKTIAQELGIDENKYIEALEKIKKVPPGQVKSAASLLFVVANTISELANKNYELMQKDSESKKLIEKESLLRKIIEISRSSLDIKEVKQGIVNELGKTFKADRCYFRAFDKMRNKFLAPDVEYLSSNKLESMLEKEPNQKALQYFSKELQQRKKGFYPIIMNVDEVQNEALKIYMTEAGIKTDYAIPLIDIDEESLWLVLHYSDEAPVPDENYNKLLEILAYNVDLTLNQLKLYHAIKRTAEREALLRKINEIIRDTLDVDKTFKLICENLAKLFNVQRVLLTQLDDSSHGCNFMIKQEYKTRKDIKGIDVLDKDNRTAKYWDKIFHKSDKILMFDDVMSSNTPNYFKDSYTNIGAKSLLASAICKGREKWGHIVLLDYDKKRLWSEDEINFLITVSNQMYISIQQTELYIQNKKQAERELLLRKVTENIRSSLNINTTLNYVCDELARVFNVQRATIIEFPDSKDYTKIAIRREYKSDKNIKGIINNNSFNFEVGKIWASVLEKEDSCFAIDNIYESDLPDLFKENYAALGQKSIIVMPIQRNTVKWGVLILSEYNYFRHWTNEEIDLLKIISNQIFIAIKQSELYNTVQKTAEKEKLLRKINEIIRDTLDIDESLTAICKEVCDFFDVQRVVITEFESEDAENYKLAKEFKTNSSIESINMQTVDKKAVMHFGKLVMQISDVFTINDILKSDVSDFFNSLYRKIGVKAIIGSVIKKNETKKGSILLFDYEKTRNWNGEEAAILRSIADMVYISIQQAEFSSKINEQVERERAILSNLPFMIWIKDSESKFLAANESFAKMCGKKVEDIIGKTDLELWPEELAQGYIKDDIEVMQKKKTKSIEEVINDPSGPKWHETFKTPLFNDKGEVVGTTGFSRDITEKKEVDKIKNEFVSMVSHELRTPLTSIRGALGLVLSGSLEKLSDKTTSLLDIANNNCLRLINLINDILDIEKIEAGKMDFNSESTDIIPLINQSVKLNTQFAQKFNVNIKFEKKVENALVYADKDRLIQVMTNLLSNAIKFSKQNSSVKILVSRRGKNIRVSTTNYGVEISDEFKKRIFQKFAQADSSDSRQKGGTGLGLSISKAIIEKMNGKINFISKNNKTTFYFDLPEILKNEDIINE